MSSSDDELGDLGALDALEVSGGGELGDLDDLAGLEDSSDDGAASDDASQDSDDSDEEAAEAADSDDGDEAADSDDDDGDDEDKDVDEGAEAGPNPDSPWVAHESDGRMYYHNSVTDETSWTAPAEGFREMSDASSVSSDFSSVAADSDSEEEPGGGAAQEPAPAAKPVTRSTSRDDWGPPPVNRVITEEASESESSEEDGWEQSGAVVSAASSKARAQPMPIAQIGRSKSSGEEDAAAILRKSPLARSAKNAAALADWVQSVQFFRDNARSSFMRQEIAKKLTVEEFEAGEVVITQGEDGDAFYILLTGSILVNVDGKDVVRLGEPYTGIGERALVAGADGKRTSTCTAEVETVMARLEADDYKECMRQEGIINSARCGFLLFLYCVFCCLSIGF